jgi:hypothetical protein
VPPTGAYSCGGLRRFAPNPPYALNTILDEQHLAQAAAAARLSLNQPKVSALRNYKLEGFSVERLMTLLNALDQDIEIVIRAKPRSRAAARISVVAG